MLDISDFESVFAFNPDYQYSDGRLEEIHNSRSIFRRKLFFDRLVEQLRIDIGHLYPPQHNRDLRELHRRIVEAQTADHYKQSLLFYILKDCVAHNVLEAPADSFARAVSLPAKYVTCMDGLYLMDRRQYKSALENLTDPSLPPLFTPEILSTLLLPDVLNASPSNLPLPLAYYNAVRPPLRDASLRLDYITYLARLDITGAFWFIRSRPEHERAEMLKAMTAEALRTHGVEVERRGDRGLEWVDLPFTEEEEEVVLGYLSEDPEGRAIPGARDAVIMRRIATGKLKEVVSDRKAAGRLAGDVNWEGVKEGISRGLGSRKDDVGFEI